MGNYIFICNKVGSKKLSCLLKMEMDFKENKNYDQKKLSKIKTKNKLKFVKRSRWIVEFKKCMFFTPMSFIEPNLMDQKGC